MTNKKTTRRALVLSILSLLVCMSMLVGTTFAWFTDNVTSGNNRIVAGNLDVELYNDVKVNEDKKVSETTPLFEEVALWEPGVVTYENLTVANVGTLALKYELSINFSNANTTPEGKTLADILDVAFVPGGVSGTREEVMAKGEAAGWMDLASFMEGNYLLPGESDVYGLVICWVPGANDNDFNMNNGQTTSDGKPLHIDLGVELFATQKTHEDDSFGPDYDAGLSTTYVSTFDELVAALQAGEKVVLKNDIADGSAPAVVPAGKTAVLDLNGHKLTMADATATYAVNNLGTLVLRDSVGGGAVNARGIYNGYDADGNYVTDAKIVVESGTFNAMGTNGGATIFNYGEAEINGGTFTAVGGYGLNNQSTGVMTITNADISGGVYNLGKLTVHGGKVYQHISGRHAVYNWSGSVTINGGEFDSISGNELILAEGQNAAVVINDGTFNKTGKSWLFGAATGQNIAFTINGGTFNGYVNLPENTVDTIRPYGDPIVVNGGVYNFDPTNWLNTGLNAQKNTSNGTWTVVPEKYTTAVADGLYSDGAVGYAVSNANGLVTLNTMMADKTAGKNVTVELTADIDMTGKTWTPVDSHADSAFSLAGLNGNGHTISNLTVNGQAMFKRFAGSGDVVIKDVTFENAKVNSTAINTSILTVQTYQNVTLDNVDVVDSYIKGGYKVAPLIATVYNESSDTITATLKNCDVANTTVEATSYDFCTTGMVAFVYAGDNDKIAFENCTVSNVKLIAPYDEYNAHAFVYTTGSGSLYNEADGVTVTGCSAESLVTNSAKGAVITEDTTLVLRDEVTLYAYQDGMSALTVTNGAKLTLVVEGEGTLTGGKNGSGIYVDDNSALEILGDGKLTVQGNATIEYEASGNYCDYDAPNFEGAGGSGIRGGEGSTITIKGLSALTAEGYGVAGFGIGGNGATVTIEDTTIDYVRGGFVNITGEYIDAKYNKSEPNGGAAIGGEKITLTNVTIEKAVGGSKAAGIGAQYHQPADITITNCYIKSVTGGASSAAIGGSRVSEKNANDEDINITIVDSVITAQGGYFGAGIGSGYDTRCQTTDIQPMTTIYIKGDSIINATGGKYAAGIGTGYHVANLAGEIEETVKVTAASGEKFYKDTYTQAQDIGFGVVDPAREALNNSSTFTYNGVANGIPAVG